MRRGSTLEAAQTAQTETTPEKEAAKKPTLKQRLKLVFNNVSRKDLKGIFWHTLKDLRKPREIGILLASSFVPGGWIAWFAYRVAKYQFNKAAIANNAEGAHSPFAAADKGASAKYASKPLVMPLIPAPQP